MGHIAEHCHPTWITLQNIVTTHGSHCRTLSPYMGHIAEHCHHTWITLQNSVTLHEGHIAEHCHYIGTQHRTLSPYTRSYYRTPSPHTRSHYRTLSPYMGVTLQNTITLHGGHIAEQCHSTWVTLHNNVIFTLIAKRILTVTGWIVFTWIVFSKWSMPVRLHSSGIWLLLKNNQYSSTAIVTPYTA